MASLMAFSLWRKLPSSNPFLSHGWGRQIVCFGLTWTMEPILPNLGISFWCKKPTPSPLFSFHNLKQKYGEGFGLSTSQTRPKICCGGHVGNPYLQSKIWCGEPSRTAQLVTDADLNPRQRCMRCGAKHLMLSGLMQLCEVFEDRLAFWALRKCSHGL